MSTLEKRKDEGKENYPRRKGLETPKKDNRVLEGVEELKGKFGRVFRKPKVLRGKQGISRDDDRDLVEKVLDEFSYNRRDYLRKLDALEKIGHAAKRGYDLYNPSHREELDKHYNRAKDQGLIKED